MRHISQNQLAGYTLYSASGALFLSFIGYLRSGHKDEFFFYLGIIALVMAAFRFTKAKLNHKKNGDTIQLHSDPKE